MRKKCVLLESGKEKKREEYLCYKIITKNIPDLEGVHKAINHPQNVNPNHFPQVKIKLKLKDKKNFLNSKKKKYFSLIA